MAGRLEGKVAIVTGAGRGIGRGEALLLAEQGVRVVVNDFGGSAGGEGGDNSPADEVVAEIKKMGGDAVANYGNVASMADGEGMVKQALDKFGRLDILINNAGKGWGESVDRFPWKAWDGVMSVNVTGLFTLTQRLAPLLARAASPESPAHIVNLGSVMGAATIAGGAYSYAPSKAAVHHLTRILAGENITVNALAPGPFQSRMMDFAVGTDEKAAKAAQDVSLRRIGRPDDIAGALLFLCGRGGSYVTGAILPIDGGVGVEAGHAPFGGAE